MKNRVVILFIFLLPVIGAFSQEFRLVATDQPLNTVLRSLSIDISFDDKALSEHKVSVKKTFQNVEEALLFLLKDKPFDVENINNVYVVVPIAKKAKEEPKKTKQYFIVSGFVKSAQNGENLPYAYIKTPEGYMQCDETGFFSLKRSDNNAIKIEAQHLGYEIQDTTVSVGLYELRLIPKSHTMNEIVVHSSPATMLIQSGKKSGELRINHQVARYMPGSVDNSVFNLLRMMPGVRASGEPSDDLIVWGSNTGECKITYDGYTLFGIKNYNDHIGSVNPYMIKDIRLSKGGYDTSLGGRIGAIAEITGNDGDFNSPSVKTSVSNYVGNFYASVPITKKLNIAAAYRQTFYNLYDNENVNIANSEDSNSSRSLSDIYIKPSYNFRDFTVKISGKVADTDSYYISLHGSDDRFKFSVKQEEEYAVNAAEKNRQIGGAASYKRVWNNGESTKFLATFSRLTSLLDNLTFTGQNGNKPTPLDISHLDNVVQEFSLKLSHNFNIGTQNKIKLGGEWQQYRVSLNEICGELDKPSAYIIDNLNLGKLSLEGGVRVDFPLRNKPYIQPRVAAKYSFSDELTASTSWGLYNQFLTRTPFLNTNESYQQVWSMADSTYMKAMHTVAGVAYSKDGFLVSLEGYSKRTKNGQYFIDNTVYQLDNTIYGIDLYTKKEIGKHTLFGAYSLVSIQKPQKELSHEIKLGGIGSFDPFFISLTYVYGTGFSYISTGGHGHDHSQSSANKQHGGKYKPSDRSGENYNRFDIAVTYKKRIKKWNLQAGASLLNVFDTQNVKYNYQLTGQTDITNVYTKATPITPIFFLEIIF